MSTEPMTSLEPPRVQPHAGKSSPKSRSGWKRAGIALGVLVTVLVAGRLVLPHFVRDYVNRTLDLNPEYDGVIGDVRLSLWRGAYSIEDIRLVKTTGSVPVPFFSARRIDLAIQTRALLAGELVGKVRIEEAVLNFVDAADPEDSQTGAGGPWLVIIRDLFPFDINNVEVTQGTIHFRAFQTDPPVDVYLSRIEGSIENLTNIHDDLTPMFASVSANALAMDQARVEYEMKLDPFSYRPTFQLALRMVGLDVTQTNALARAYGRFDFERGWFDFVTELDVKEGALKGYVKPLFRDLVVFDLKEDSRNPLQAFWEALVGIVAAVFENPERNQVATVIPLKGYLENPNADYLATIGNILHNAFVRAYLPNLQNTASEISGLAFEPGSVTEPEAIR